MRLVPSPSTPIPDLSSPNQQKAGELSNQSVALPAEINLRIDDANRSSELTQNLVQSLLRELADLKSETQTEINNLHHRIYALEYQAACAQIDQKEDILRAQMGESAIAVAVNMPSPEPSRLLSRMPSSSSCRRIHGLEPGVPDKNISGSHHSATFAKDRSDASCAASKSNKHGNALLELSDLLRVPSQSVMDELGDRIVDEYEWEMSTWDVGVLAFMQFFTWRESVANLLMYLFNVAVQGAFLVLTWKELAVPFITSTTKDDVWLWRVTTAHDMKFIDPITDLSLARKICDDSDATSVSSMPSLLQKQLNAYKSGWLGIVMCVLSMVIWWLTTSIELQDAFKMLCGLFRMPTGQETVIEKTDIGFRVQAVTTRRKVWIIHICLSRFTIASLLLYVGSNFLMYTVDIEDLLLNAVALELILNLDELLFHAISPFKAAKLIPKLEPLPVVTLRQKYGFGFDLAGRMVIFALFIMFVGWTTTLGLTVVRDVQEVFDALCEHKLDFVYVMDPGGAVVAHQTPRYPPNTTQSYRYQAVYQAITEADAVGQNVETSLTDSAAGLYWSPLSLAERPLVNSGKRMSELNPRCVDNSGQQEGVAVWPGDFTKLLVKDALSNFGVTFRTCEDAVQYCNADNLAGVRMRQWCPKTCGCHQANSSLILTNIDSGCPPPCTRLPSWISFLSQTPCADHQPNSALFRSYLDGLHSLQLSYEQNIVWDRQIGAWIEQLSTHGCAGHSLGAFGDLCGDNAFKLKPITLLCPVTCGCPRPTVEGHPRLCPDTCASTVTR